MHSLNPIAAAIVLVALFSTGCADSQSAEPNASASAISFTDVTEAAGLSAFRHDNGSFGQAWAPEIVGAGCGFIDFDGDGWLDILLVGGGRFRERQDRPVRALWLFRNEGDGTFSDRTREAGLDGFTTFALGVVAADYDNDGDEDFFLSTLYENLLFRNDGGVFAEVGRQAGVGDTSEWSTSALFFDADRDGNLDLYVGGYVDWTPDRDIYCDHDGKKVYCTPQEYRGITGRFYRNNGNGTFTERTREAGFAEIPGKVFGVVELDFNKDGWSDLFIAEDTERDLLFENNGDGTFTERGVLSGVAFDKNGRPRAGMGADAAVVDSSGEVTIFVGNFSDETFGVYRHLGGGLFQDRVAAAKLAHSSLMTLTFGLFLFDAELDGDLDLLAANGHVQTQIERIHQQVKFRQPAQLFLNAGDGTFDEVVQHEGVLTQPMVARGAAYGDYDRDGDLDVLLSENNGPVHLWRNETNGGFIRVQLEGRESNRDGLGSRVVLYSSGKPFERRVRTGSSYLSQSEKSPVFGLPDSGGADSLIVYWPSGTIDRIADLRRNDDLLIVEGIGVTRRDRPALAAAEN